MLALVYNALLTLGLALCAPWLALRLLRADSRQVALARLGLGRRWLPAPPPPGGLWLHALSVGEVRSAVPLLRGLAARFPRRPLIFSVGTAQGLAMARQQLAGMEVTTLVRPLDAPWAVGRLLDVLRPALFCLVEGDIWPAWQWALARRGAPRLLVNGRVSPRTFKSYRRAPALARGLFAGFDRVLAQTETDRQRLAAIGVGDDRLAVGGNLKFDSAPASLDRAAIARIAHDLGLAGRLVLVAGSTHQGEEEPCLEALAALKDQWPDLALLLAPREVRRGGAVARLAAERGFRVARVSQGRPPEGCDVVVLDVLGRLAQAYAIGRAAFVGGSLCAVGGHNLLEPAAHGVPVVFGPVVHNFLEMAQMLEDIGGGARIQSGDELLAVWRELLAEPLKATAMGRAGREFCQAHRGAVARAVEEAAGLLERAHGC